MSSGDKALIRIEHLSKSYRKGSYAVEDLSLEIFPGDIYGFIGQNGAGKSTTIRAMVGILPYEQGDIRFGELSMRRNPFECKKMFAFLPDTPELYPHMSGIGYLNFIGDIFRIKKNVRAEKIRRYAAAFEIEDALGNMISSYSHGMKQKLSLIAAFLHDPKVLILDEPFVGLDPKTIHVLKEMMLSYVADGNAIFFSSHVLEVVEKLCNKVAIIRSGHLLAEGPLERIKGDESLEDLFLELTDHA